MCRHFLSHIDSVYEVLEPLLLLQQFPVSTLLARDAGVGQEGPHKRSELLQQFYLGVDDLLVLVPVEKSSSTSVG